MTRQLSDQELRLWLRVARTVKPAHPSVRHATPEDRIVSRTPATQGATLGSTAAAKPAMVRTAQERPAEDHSRHRRVRRGQVDIDATIDLHGYTQDVARRALVQFVEAERMSGARCLLVITGKGREGTGVLRRRFLDWINEQDLRPHISGYSVANVRHGGDGAFYLLLKRKSRT